MKLDEAKTKCQDEWIAFHALDESGNNEVNQRFT